MCVRVYMCACMRKCVCVRACVSVCVRVCQVFGLMEFLPASMRVCTHTQHARTNARAAWSSGRMWGWCLCTRSRKSCRRTLDSCHPCQITRVLFMSSILFRCLFLIPVLIFAFIPDVSLSRTSKVHAYHGVHRTTPYVTNITNITPMYGSSHLAMFACTKCTCSSRLASVLGMCKCAAAGIAHRCSHACAPTVQGPHQAQPLS